MCQDKTVQIPGQNPGQSRDMIKKKFVTNCDAISDMKAVTNLGTKRE
jgi:hypothetical protein